MKVEVSRRDFLKKITELSTTLGISIVYLSFGGCEKDWFIPYRIEGVTVEIDLTNEKSDILGFPILNFIGSGVTKQFNNVNYGIPVIIVRVKKEGKEDDFVCFSGMCTHDQCFGKDKVRTPIKIETVQNQKICRVVCTCHGSEFNILNGGAVLKGPAEKPLRQFQCKFNSETNILTILF